MHPGILMKAPFMLTRSRFIRFLSSTAACLYGLTTLPAQAVAENKASVGVSLPTIATQRWVTDGLAISNALDKLGYKSDLQYASDDIKQQITQIETMLTNGVKVLVIAPIDGTKLTAVLKKAADQKVTVVCYDRLITASPNVDYYATFDNYQVGVLQGHSIVTKLGLNKNKGPFNIELFAGSSDDNNAIFFYDGAMSILKPYLKSGQLVVGSGVTERLAISTRGWIGSVARSRLTAILRKTYTKDKLNAVLAPNDNISIELQSELRRFGYGTSITPMPVITGQDGDIAAVRSIIKGQQTSTVFKDTRNLAQVTATMVQSILSHKAPEINDTKTYNNGFKIVPSYLLKPVTVDQSNWRPVLVNSGFYKATLFNK
jgi:putative multiple sugar transport system substrate-binding protein